MGRFLILGKEERQKYLFQMLCARGQTVTYCDSWLDGGYDAIMLPPAKTAEYLEHIADKLQAGEYVFGCNFPPEMAESKRRQGVFFIDYMKEPGAAYANACATAEGALAEAVLSGKEVLCGKKILVMGYGRCGQVLAQRLHALGGNVTVYEKDLEKLEIAKVFGLGAVMAWEEEDDTCDTGAVTVSNCSLETKAGEKQPGEFWGQFGYIFNTIPDLVLSAQRLGYVRRDAVLIDIASSPGGLDYAFCAQNGLNAKLCSGLPAKYAPKSAAELLFHIIESYLNLSERGVV